MYFEKDNNKKNHKITFSITLAIMLLASSVAILSFVKEKSFAQTSDPVTNCFLANGSFQDAAYQQSVDVFDKALPNDQTLKNIAASVGDPNPIRNTNDLYVLLTGNLSSDNLNQVENEISSLLAAAGFTAGQQENLNDCIDNVAPNQSD